MGDAISATCYFPPDVPAATISTVLRFRVSLKAASESGGRKAQQGASVSQAPFQGRVTHALSGSDSTSSWPCRILPLSNTDSHLQAPVTIASLLLYLTYKRRRGKSQDFSRLCAKVHEKLTHQKFFFNFQHKTHKTVSDKHNLCLHEQHRQWQRVTKYLL